jgi:hypothetical protein
MLLLDGMATSLAAVLICWAVAYFTLLKPKGIKVGAAKAAVHITLVDVAVALISAAIPSAMTSLTAAAVLSAVSCVILRSSDSTTKA